MSPNARGYLIATLAIAGLAGVVWMTTRKPSPSTRPAPPPTVVVEKSVERDAGRKPRGPDDCEGIGKRYDVALAAARSCSVESDCVVEARGPAYGELDGCFRVTNKQPKIELERLALEWLSTGCANPKLVCGKEPRAACRAGVCVERPAPPIFDDWQRVGVRAFFTIFVPGEMVAEPFKRDWVYGFLWRGGGRSVKVWSGRNRVPRESFETLLSSAPGEIDGRAVTVDRLRVFGKLVVEAVVENVALPPWRSLRGERERKPLTIELECERDDLCDVARILLDSIAIAPEPIP